MDRSLPINTKDVIYIENGNILYLMVRDCRIEDNHALLLSQKIAIKQKQGLIIGFCLIMPVSNRQFQFLNQGLQEVANKAKELNIGFIIINDITNIIKTYKISQIISDFSPLKPILKFKSSINISCIDVDTHNIVPVWIASDKQEYAARTIRPKIKKFLRYYAVEPGKIKKHPFEIGIKLESVSWSYYKPKFNNEPITWCKGGYSNGMKQLKFFINHIKGYADNRNDPLKNATSNLSPWLHFGNISSLRCYLEVKRLKHKKDVDVFLEEIIIRKELSDNFCYYNKDYDSIHGLPNWALQTLHKHEQDKRETIYSLKELLHGKTYDKAWNYAQEQLMQDGKINTYMRMYWGKKIIEWTSTIAMAHKLALYLNDMYSIDGIDPNGYVGVLWCFGLHDRPWKERSIYGKIRFMSQVKQKFM